VTGDYFHDTSVKLGTIEIRNVGDVTLSIHPNKEGWQPMNVRSIEFEPVENR
jgi:hypothetical protein